jgi:tetrahydromethanopterin S-methyltransferase subunit G
MNTDQKWLELRFKTIDEKIDKLDVDKIGKLELKQSLDELEESLVSRIGILESNAGPINKVFKAFTEKFLSVVVQALVIGLILLLIWYTQGESPI